MVMDKKVVVKLDKVVVEEMSGLGSVSKKVMYLWDMGMSGGDISRVLGIRYQWVRNVVVSKGKWEKRGE
jgi:hypothetical protein